MTELEPAQPSIVVRPGPTPPPGYTDADFTISAAAAQRLLDAPAENTRRAHAIDWAAYEAWCAERGRVALPATAQTLLDYITYLIDDRGLAPSSIDRAMGSIRAIHRQQGHDDQPPVKPARAVLRAYRRQWSDDGHRARKATPIKISALRDMVDTCPPGKPIGVRDRAILLLGFALMARRSELAALDLADIRPGKEGLDVLIRKSKTDQAARGQEVAVLAGQHPETCPVRATQEWVKLLNRRGVTEGALFRPIDRHGRIGDDPKALAGARPRLTGHAIGAIIRRHALAAGLADPSSYRGHSLRSGGASSAYEAGAPVASVADLGRWAEGSPIVLGYVRAVDKWKNHPMRGVGL